MSGKARKATLAEESIKKTKKTICVKDCIIGTLVVAFFGVIICSRLNGLKLEQWTDEIVGIIGDMAIYFLGVIGVFEFCFDNGMIPFIPNWFIEHKEKSLSAQTKEYLQEFFDKESEYLEQHEEGRLAEALSMMGLSAESYKCVKAKVLEARLAEIHGIDDARQKILDLIFYSDVVCDLRRDASFVNSESLAYYLKFHDLMHDTKQCSAIAHAVATFVSITCEQNGIDLSAIDVIMVPHSSNYLLGLSVSKILNKHFIKMIPPDKRVGKYSYEGVIPKRITKNTVDVLILHDVLLTGRQIYESANSLLETLPNCHIHGLFSVVYRNVKDGKTVLEMSHHIKCYSLIELTEADIEQELKKRNKC